MSAAAAAAASPSLLFRRLRAPLARRWRVCLLRRPEATHRCRRLLTTAGGGARARAFATPVGGWRRAMPRWYTRAVDAPASRGMSPVQKAGWALVGTGALCGIGFVSYQGTYLASESSRNDELRKQMGLPFPLYMRQRLEATYNYILGGLGITAASATIALRTGMAARIASLGMFGSLGVMAICGIAPMWICMSIDEASNKPSKQLAWAVSTAGMGLMISPIGYLGGQILFRAAVGTGLMVGSIASVAATAPSESFLWMAAPLNMGLGVVVLSSFGTFFFPASPILHNIVLYGGLGLFGGYVLFDTQKLQYNAQHNRVYSPIDQSYSLYLDTINIFIRMAQILAMQQSGRRR